MRRRSSNAFAASTSTFAPRRRGLPAWLNDFVATGYAHYATQLPEAFADRGTRPEQLAAMLAFVFTLEGLALAKGCSRSQLVIAIEHAAPQAADPEKVGLLWAAEWLVQRKEEDDVRRGFADVLDHPLGRSAYPRYLSGFLQALAFAPRIAPLAMELLGRAFAELADAVLLPWMPTLLSELRPRRGDVLPTLFAEVLRAMPRNLAQLDAWAPPWAHAETDVPMSPSPTQVARDPESEAAPLNDAASALVQRWPAATAAWAQALSAR